MKQQILLIHGGDSYEQYEDYLQSLRQKEITLDRIRAKGWKISLQKELGDEYDVLAPKFPNAQNARFEEWKIIFEKLLPLLDDNIILIGHSLGGLFLAKYGTENKIQKAIKATFLLAAPYSTTEHEPIGDFTLKHSFQDVGITGQGMFLYHSRDDVVVPFENMELYAVDLPEATVRIFEDKGHFNAERFPEIIEDLRKLSVGH